MSVKAACLGLVLALTVSAGIAAGQLQVTNTPPPPGTYGVSYSTTLTATGGTPPYSSWAVVSGSLPPGLALDPNTGAITGAPTGGSANFGVTVQDSLSNESPEAFFSIGIFAPVSIQTSSLPGDDVGDAYSQTLAATGGASSTYTWAVASGSLPPGLMFNTATGVISGTPTTATGSPFSFSVTASDNAGRVSPAQSLSIVIAASTTPSTVTLTSSANPAIYGRTVTLTATLTPSAATGKVTFYDGVSVLGIIPVAGGRAAIATIMLGAGSHSLRAYFNGLPSYSTASSAVLTETVNAVAGSGLRAPVTYSETVPGNGAPYTVLVADFNGDGKADVESHGVFLGNGDGTFQTSPFTGQANGAFTSPVFDFNNDGIPDTFGFTGVSLGNGDGTYQAQINFPTVAGVYPGDYSAVAVGDFNGDGIADIFEVAGVDRRDFFELQGVLFAGNGDGTFHLIATGIDLGESENPTSASVIAMGDFNGDGKTDLALDNFKNTQNALSIYLGNGDGTFRALGGVSLGNSGIYTVAGAMGDFNGDGKLDLAVTDPVNNAIDLLAGNGDGTFQAAVVWIAGTLPQALAVGDFNGDGRPDIVSTLFNNGANQYNQFTVRLGSAAPLTITATTLPGGAIGASYSATLTATGGTGSYSNWTISSGSLPSGLALNATNGTITGTPTAASVAAFYFTVQDSNGNTAPQQPFSITIGPAQGTQTQTILFGALNNAILGAGSVTVSAAASSGLTVGFSSSTTSICTVSGNTVTLLAAGACSITAGQGGNATYAAAAPVTQSFMVLAVQPVAAFLDLYGAPALTFNESPGFPDAGGLLAGLPGVAQAPDGDVYVVGLDNEGGVHLNSFSFTNSAWNGWQYSGGILDTSSGMTTAIAPNRVVWFTGRDTGNRYWINSWNGAGFGGWILLDQGIFAHDSVPQIAITSDGTIWVVGKDIGGRIWSNSYNPSNQTFTGWVDRQAVITGQPSATAGQDGFVYVAVRSVSSNSPVYVTRIPANNAATANTWLNGGGLIDSYPQITSQGGTVYLMALAGGETVYLLTFSEANQTYGSWTYTNGALNDATIATQGGNVFIAGRDSANRIDWYSLTASGWFTAGGAGISSTVLAGGK